MPRRSRPSTKRPRQNTLELPRLEPIPSRRSLTGHAAPPTEPRTLARQAVRRIEHTDRGTVAAHIHASRSVFVFLLVQRLRGQQNSAVECIRQATVATTDLHSDDDEFGEGFELA